MFLHFPWSTGLLHDARADAQPSSLFAWHHDTLALDSDATHFGFVFEGPLHLNCDSGSFELSTGMYYCVPGAGSVGGAGRGISLARWGYGGFFQIGGPVEPRGRLRYIDGCTDSLLIPPVVCGDACLNLLHIPPHTHQTRHTHPSLRAGVIVRGRGICRTPNADTPLEAGMVFVIPAESPHSFHTAEQDLLVIAYHPDSDTGPTHDDHPMVNRTIVNGRSASAIQDIRT